ncbi:hypothetical protein ILUMI_25370 [Ignelater luminosus]|uniref:Uncharacterized protein n=1 Tax=Ignelater luminosus TaxID=2038154 RepID=A0A8K0G006_IGNLU|nr:hypothetical protein ILUMI_25370 [Ignelater luminosus]
MKKYQVEVMALQETKQQGSNITPVDDYLFYTSEGEQRTLGTGFLLKEEEAFVSYISAMNEFGFPLTTQDLRHVIRSFLDRIGRLISYFEKNMPGKNRISSFLRRHLQLTARFAANIKRNMGATDETTLCEYINNLAEVVRKVPRENIWNFDETNLTDNPGQRKLFVARGKYVTLAKAALP